MKKRYLFILIVFAVFYTGFVSWEIGSIQQEPTPVEQEAFSVSFDEPEVNIYQIAAEITGCPERILRGIAFAESSYNPDAVGDDGKSIGLCQINEDFHDERAQKYGEYNPYDPLDSLVIAGRLYVDNLKVLKSERLAVTAHKMGLTGAKRGEVSWYVDRVLNAA